MGLVTPSSGAGTNAAGIPDDEQSIRCCEATSSHVSGEVGQQSNIARGLRVSSSEPPATTSNNSLMFLTPSFLNAPVTIGFDECFKMI